MNGTNVAQIRVWIAWPVSRCFTAHVLSFLLSCGDHFNPDGMSHGGPQDPDRVSVGLGEPWAERGPRVSEAGQAALGSRECNSFLVGLFPSLYFVHFRNIY